MKVIQGQTLLDIAIQKLGSAEGMFDLAVLNGISPTDDLIAGQELALPDIIDSDVVSYYTNKNIIPATHLTIQAQAVATVVDTVYRDVQTLQSNLIPILQGQTIFDIAVQEFGSVEAAYPLATLNGMSVTDDLVPGTLLQKTAIINKTIASYYSNKALTPATGIIATSDVLTRIFDNTFDLSFN